MIERRCKVKTGLQNRWCVLWFALGIIAVLNTLRMLAGWLAQRGVFDYAPEAHFVVECAVTAILILFLIPAVMLVLIGWRTQKNAEYPPPGRWRSRRATVLCGDEAIRRGKYLIRLGGAAILLLFASIFVTRLINHSFLNHPMKWIPREAGEKSMHILKRNGRMVSIH